ncbi:hypothetical protein WKH02_03855 [Pantoea agglomerans]|uniref:hypothetical protein n=1 Tax=Enterobacter agglomerans TaxID=549 RepID=UPI0016549149|nr:hypothetical protein [Pantoea agglomerans]
MMDGDWIIESDITDAEQQEVTAAPGARRLWRREDGFLGRKSTNPGQLAGIFVLIPFHIKIS